MTRISVMENVLQKCRRCQSCGKHIPTAQLPVKGSEDVLCDECQMLKSRGRCPLCNKGFCPLSSTNVAVQCDTCKK